MIRVSDALRAAMVADSRRVRVKAVVRIIDPDIVHGALIAPTQAPWSDESQLYDDILSLAPPLITLEQNKWVLSGNYVSVENRGENAESAYVSEIMSNADGSFNDPIVITSPVSAVNNLFGASVFFSDRKEDGFPADFTIEVLDENGVVASKTFAENTKVKASLDGFRAEYPTAIRLTITRWTIPNRRVRIAEIVVGIYEQWTGDELAECDIHNQGDFTGLAIPYGTCRLTMDNFDRRFEPRNKDGLFAAIEERQAIFMYLGADTENGTEYVPAGVFYQYERGWKTGANRPTMTWDLVDIIGLLQDRQFALPSALPTTLKGWVSALCDQLGANFSGLYQVDQEYESVPCTVDNVTAINGVTCGQLLIWICQATGTFARADTETGYLTIEPYWNEGVNLTLDNIYSYPEMSANDDIALINFTLSNGTQVAWNGNSLAASKTASVNNPFLHTVEQARKAAEQIITAHGGNQVRTTGRGDFTSEIGDVATVQLDESRATTGRVMEQNFAFQDGILKGCQTKMLQASGGKLFDETVLITESGEWVCPTGVTYIRLAIGQGGKGGGHGLKGYIREGWSGVEAGAGEAGKDGTGGKVWFATVPVVEQTAYAVHIGSGGAAATVEGEEGQDGEHTTFAAYSSVNGEVFPNGYTDVLNGNSYARTGVAVPAANTSDGGKGGEGGEAGQGYIRVRTDAEGHEHRDFRITKQPGPGKRGANGASGFCLIQYVRVVNNG